MGLPDFQVDMVDPDFTKIAEAMGIKGITINDPAELDAKLNEAFATEGPVLVNVFTDPHALSLPPKIELKMVEGMAVSMTKMMLSGKFEDVLDTVRDNYKHMKALLD